jgi:hypothetical protein
MIALSILIIMTGAASYYLGDILFKAKVAKVKNDMETIAGAIVLNDAENPTELLDTGLIGTSATGALGALTPVNERQGINNLVGSYLLTTVYDPWQTSYKVNSYAGYVKSFANDYAVGGTSKYDKDIMTYYLPESLFLAKCRAQDLNGNTFLDTGDEVILYFSKSVRCNVTDTAQANGNVTYYNGVTAADIVTPYGIEPLDVHYAPVGGGVTITAEEGGHDNPGLTETFVGAQSAPADVEECSWTPHDLWAFRPGGLDAGLAAAQVDEDETITTGESGGIEGADVALGVRENFGFHRPGDPSYYASCFDRRVKFWMSNTGVAHGSDSSNLDIGYEIYIPTIGDANLQQTTPGAGVQNFAYGYAIWESSKGMIPYKTIGEKKKIYLLEQTESLAKRSLLWKSIVD